MVASLQHRRHRHRRRLVPGFLEIKRNGCPSLSVAPFATGRVGILIFLSSPLCEAATLGFSVAKPWGESEPYDVIVRSGKLLWRVQIKSVKARSSQKQVLSGHPHKFAQA